MALCLVEHSRRICFARLNRVDPRLYVDSAYLVRWPWLCNIHNVVAVRLARGSYLGRHRLLRA